MSIKKLFGSTDKVKNYLSDTTEKEAFIDAESARNVEAIKIKQDTFVPQVDYSKPENFAKYGSAYLYYKSAIERIHDYYPYDGSDAEINEFQNGLLDIEKYIFDDLYPRTTGYAIISEADGGGWGSLDGSQRQGYGLPSTLEYITLYGGPNTSSYTNLADAFPNPHDSKTRYSNIYDTSIYQTEGLPTDYASGSRESNLKTDFDNGVTVEFWLKTGSLVRTLTDKQVIFDMWNNAASGTADYGRITIELSSSIPLGADAGTTSPLVLTVQSGASGLYTSSLGLGLSASSFSDWAHYAIVLQNTGSTFLTKLYVDGVLNQATASSTTLNEINSKDMMARIGALLTSSVLVPAVPGAASASAGAGKLSGSIDEFRFWKVARDANQIARYYFDQVAGGANTDISNTTLGVYYKFNEGITLTSSTDSTVLDYSGRISNGVWTGYNSNSRNTGSAIVSASAASTEYRDPIIYSYHNDVENLKSDLLNSGSGHDAGNNNMFVNLAPSWVIEEQDDKLSDLRKVSHIAGAYFDKLSLQIDALPSFKSTTYTSASYAPLPFAKHLPQSLGLYMPELFIDSSVMEKFLNRDQKTLFESDLNETKNLIYLNLYNNLANIYKSKGTEKSIRNVLRCFNLDDRLIRLNVYSDNQTYKMENNLKQTQITNKYINFNHTGNVSAVVYSFSSSANPDALQYITGSGINAYRKAFETKYGYTVEADITFPSYNNVVDPVNRPQTASLFGAYRATTGAAATNDTTFRSDEDQANFQVYAIRTRPDSTDAYFQISSSVAPYSIPKLTSSVFFDVYDNEDWNISVRIKPSNYPLTDNVTGSWVSHNSTVYDYDIIFSGYNTSLGAIKDSFTVTASLSKETATSASASPKKLYAGARKTNITGAILNSTDVLFSGLRYWTKYLEDGVLKQHAVDPENVGISGSYQNLSALDSNNTGYDMINRNTLALQWNFSGVTGSDSGGNFEVKDISSGSLTERNEFGWLGRTTGYQYMGRGDGFEASTADVVEKRLTNTFKFVDPERPVSSDMIQILSDDDTVFRPSQNVPSYFYVVEKSMYNAISEEMLTFFAGAIDFNNVIGEPINRYRGRYKAMEKLRESFFRRVTTVSDVEKFVTYYKWFDDALSEIISQLVPASSEFVPDVLNTIESHVLERNKYKSLFPTIEKKESTEGPAMGINELTYNWRLGHRPLSNKENTNSRWWNERADREHNSIISSGDTNINIQRERQRRIIINNNNQTASTLVTRDKVAYTGSTYALRRLAKPYKLQAIRTQVYKGGVNFTDNKNIHFTYNALYPAGPFHLTGASSTTKVPENVLVFFADEIVPLKDSVDVTVPHELQKIKRYFKVVHGREYEDGIGYSNVKSSYVLPFNIMSSSVTTGFNSEVSGNITGGIEITNLHNDVYGPDMEVPMQGAFTNFAVGGHQSRHIRINTGSDDHTSRPEAWKLLLGTITGSTPDVTGALGMVGADYPYPITSDYPATGSEKAVFYRGFVAKRPVNIRNIQSTTASVLGNYDKNWQVVQTVGAFQNPRHFIDSQPTLPSEITQTYLSSSQARSLLDIHRTDQGHTQPVSEYSIGYLTGANNNTVITCRFRAPGGIEIQTPGYGDIRSAEFSAYNSLNHRNSTVIKRSQGPSGSISEATGAGTTGIRVYDIHGKDYGLLSHLSRHSARFGRDSIFVTAPGTTYAELPAFHKVQRNNLFVPEVNVVDSISTGSQFDNFFVQHQIPRSDRQYAWVTRSLATGSNDMRYYGYAPTQGIQKGQYSSSTGLSAFFNFVSGSDVHGTTFTQLYQPLANLNIMTVDAVDESPTTANLLGFSSTASNQSYVNTTLVTKLGMLTQIAKETSYFNMLMARRQANFGWSWNGARNNDHPILVKQRRNNALVIANSPVSASRMSPLSSRGRPIYINISIDGAPATIKSTYGNSNIYFSDTSVDNIQYPDTPVEPTAFDQMVELTKANTKYALNWVYYSEGIFPSLSREYVSSSQERTGYNNKFWRGNTTDRVSVGATFDNSYSVTVSQSCWPLEAQTDFITRTGAIAIDNAGTPFDQLTRKGKAGELQNNYFMVASGAQGVAAGAVVALKNTYPGALYSRKHLLSSPRSVVSPNGVRVAETASLVISDTIDVYAGEAKWEADTQAGIVVKNDTTSLFESSASAPWFNEYSDFKADLKIMAKDYAIVPEFRISEHVEDYIKYGLFNKNKLDTFEIVGTGIDSAANSFYKDYTNSEFMSNFAKVQNDVSLNTKEIKLVVNAVIRFNPYKGFYPAQRTLDLMHQFSRSYANGFAANGIAGIVQKRDGTVRPLLQTMFSPGIIYNSIKAGIAVDYPLATDGTKISRDWFGSAFDTDNWMLTTGNTGSATPGEGYNGGQYWDLRVPFEAAIEPEKYLAGLEFFDVEPHPSAALNVTSSWIPQSQDSIYSLMANNFFGEVASFFLKDQNYTRLESGVVTDDLQFETGSVYGARLKIRRSTQGPRTYEFESGSNGKNDAYTNFGGRIYDGTNFGTASFPLPQDPRQNVDFKETFTMYSRPSAFGPPIAGRPTGSHAVSPVTHNTFPLDGINGFNWAYTPPYYHGESWVDFVFRPQSGKAYDLEQILAETKVVCWRADPGISASNAPAGGPGPAVAFGTQIIRTFSSSATYPGVGDLIYDGNNINHNAMQLTSSLNYFGVERVTRQKQDKFGNEISSENETVGKKWVIQPKWETPMLNFNDEGIHPITNAADNLTLPLYGSESVPRGMWHQFGVVPESADKGIFLEIGDVPTNWLKSHYSVITDNSAYNDNDASTNGASTYEEMQSLSKIVDFNSNNSKVRLGELKEKLTISEAIVAIPYIVESVVSSDEVSGEESMQRKKFINIPRERIDSALNDAIGSAQGDSLDAAGESIRKLVQKMQRYVLPPQFDFLSTPELEPIAMYIFEFNYSLDKDDLSYIWQNLAPREYQKITMTAETIAHNLGDNELLSADNLMNNDNMRWMVFKIKQRAQTDYTSLMIPQVGQASNGDLFNFDSTSNGYKVGFNWPYDYLSFVELIKVDAEVLYGDSEEETEST